jgi:hypothetical protein
MTWRIEEHVTQTCSGASFERAVTLGVAFSGKGCVEDVRSGAGLCAVRFSFSIATLMFLGRRRRTAHRLATCGCSG